MRLDREFVEDDECVEPSRLGVGVLERDMVGSGGWNSLLEKGS